jgi:hypothetical protein
VIAGFLAPSMFFALRQSIFLLPGKRENMQREA